MNAVKTTENMHGVCDDGGTYLFGNTVKKWWEETSTEWIISKAALDKPCSLLLIHHQLNQLVRTVVGLKSPTHWLHPAKTGRRALMEASSTRLVIL
jgi:hypothetical protein